MLQLLHKSLGPIILSALSFLLSFFLIELLTPFFGAEFSLFKLSGIGKIGIMIAALLQMSLFVSVQKKPFFTRCSFQSIGWLSDKKSWVIFIKFFSFFALLHIGILLCYLFAGFAYIGTISMPLLVRRIPVLLLAALGTFGVAWSEEIIFRSVLFHHFRRYFGRCTSVVIASFIFMILHDLKNPVSLLTSKLSLGIGLFLLGVFLNYLMLAAQSIAASTGAHAGLVFIKAVLRKFPVIAVIPSDSIWFPVDLRCSLLIHILFIMAIALVARITPNKEQQEDE